jgi:hypothetical protein
VLNTGIMFLGKGLRNTKIDEPDVADLVNLKLTKYNL